MKVVVIGSAGAVWGFALAGVAGQIVETQDELEATLEAMLERSDIGVILVTSDVVDLARERIEAIMARSEVPLLVEIPGPAGSSPNRLSIRDLLRRTTGANV
jgi:vacuolar-type H+-ATPase subunit F/Vma7